MEALWLALETSALGETVRSAVWLYPAANVIHVLAVMGFFGVVAAMDLALLGITAPTATAPETVRTLRPVAGLLLAVIAGTGAVLLSAEATAIAANPAFGLKALAIALALFNVIANTIAMRREGGAAVRVTAAASLALWLMVAALGRLIAYF